MIVNFWILICWKYLSFELFLFAIIEFSFSHFEIFNLIQQLVKQNSQFLIDTPNSQIQIIP